ncbi:MAG: hypothetical protein KIT54_04080 [Phycisphaeraceae bacterium]|nr:hypothetical protein [Phycisphaeraceae bacterium]
MLVQPARAARSSRPLPTTTMAHRAARPALVPLALLLTAALAGCQGGACRDCATPTTPTTAQAATASPDRAGASGGGVADLGQQLVEAMRSVPGCLDAQTGRMASGKSVIIGWFEDVHAARRWYDHPMHRGMMGRLGPAAGGDGGGGARGPLPLAHVPEGVPLMIVASVTFTDRPSIPGVPMPISQIGIEVFAPVPGGATINGRLSPESFPVEHMRHLNP